MGPAILSCREVFPLSEVILRSVYITALSTCPLHSYFGMSFYRRFHCVATVEVTVLLVLLQITELDISKTLAEKSLREHNGDLIRTLHTLTC